MAYIHTEVLKLQTSLALLDSDLSHFDKLNNVEKKILDWGQMTSSMVPWPSFDDALIEQYTVFTLGQTKKFFKQ